MTRTVLAGLLLALLAAYPHLALTAAVPAGYALRWLVAQPTVWALAVGLYARPHLARRLIRRAR